MSRLRGVLRGPVYRSIAGICRRVRLLGLWFIEIRGLTGPALIGQLRQLLYLQLPDDILLLLSDGGRVVADMTEPLVPLCYMELASCRSMRGGGSGWARTGDFDVCVVSFRVIFDDSTQVHCVPRLFELPERVSTQVRA